MHIEFSNDLLTNSLKASSSSSFCVLGLLGSEESCAFIPRLAASDLADIGVAPPPTLPPEDWLAVLDISCDR